jgi:hypothetical protein
MSGLVMIYIKSTVFFSMIIYSCNILPTPKAPKRISGEHSLENGALPPSTPNQIHMISVDLNSNYVRVTAIDGKKKPSSIVENKLSESITCSENKNILTKNVFVPINLVLQAIIFQGFININTTRISTNSFGATFSTYQPQSSTWTLNTKGANSNVSLALARPNLLSSVVFKATNSTQGAIDNLDFAQS